MHVEFFVTFDIKRLLLKREGVTLFYNLIYTNYNSAISKSHLSRTDA